MTSKKYVTYFLNVRSKLWKTETKVNIIATWLKSLKETVDSFSPKAANSTYDIFSEIF